MALKFLHLPRAKKYNVQYRFYDPVKEELLERERIIKERLGIKPDATQPLDANYRANIKGQFRAAMNQATRTSAEAKRKSNRRLLMLILFLAILAYLLFIW